MTTYKKFTKDVGLAGIAQLVTSLKGLILLPILTKTLGAESYGIWAQIMVTVSLLMPLALLQLGLAMVRFLAAEKNEKKIGKGFCSIFAAASLTAFSLSLLIFILAEPFAVAVFGGADATYFVRLAAFLILLVTLDQIIIEYFVAFRQMERYAVFMILQTIGEIALIGYLVLSGYGLFGAIISLLVVKAILFATGFLLVGREIRITKPSISVIKPYLAFSLPLLPYSLCQWVVNMGDRYVIGYFIGIEAVGIYSASYALGSLIAFSFAPLSPVLFPAITNLYENNKIQEVKTHLKYSFKFFLMFAVPSLFGLSILSKSLLKTLTTSEFIGGHIIVPIVALGMIFFICSSICTQVLMVFKETKKVALINGFSASINMIMNIILVPLIGIMGAAIATLITFMVHLFVMSNLSFKKLSFDVDLKFIMKSTVSSGVMGLIILKLNPIGAADILISIAVGAIVYFTVLVILKGFTREEYVFLKSIVRSVI